MVVAIAVYAANISIYPWILAGLHWSRRHPGPLCAGGAGVTISLSLSMKTDISGIFDYLMAASSWWWVGVDSGRNEIPQLGNSFIMRSELDTARHYWDTPSLTFRWVQAGTVLMS